MEKPKSELQSELFKKLLPQDLVKFGLIPEFVGRLPVVTTVDPLTREAFVEIMTKPKNALIKQYKKLFELDGVKLEFEAEAIDAIVDKAIERKTGARGLRAILEETMRDVMFEIPTDKEITECIITKDTVLNKKSANIIRNGERRVPMANAKTKKTRRKKVEEIGTAS